MCNKCIFDVYFLMCKKIYVQKGVGKLTYTWVKTNAEKIKKLFLRLKLKFKRERHLPFPSLKIPLQNNGVAS